MMTQELTGIVESILFRNEENGYTVFTLISGAEETTCVGCFAALSKGETVAVYGSYTDHPSYGRQFKAERYEIRIPKDAAAVERYLGSGVIRGIGVTLAHRIVMRFGDDTLRILKEEPERLAEIKGISDRIARDIGEQAEAQDALRDAMMYLQGYGIPLSTGLRIYKRYGADMYAVLRENPYRLAEDIDGIGFRTADEIASKIGYRADSEFRIRCALQYILRAAAQEGSVYLPEEEAVRRCGELIGVSEEEIIRESESLVLERKLILRRAGGTDGTVRALYDPWYYQLELHTARMLCDLNAALTGDEEFVRRKIQSLVKTSRFTLEEEQINALTYAVRYGLCIITGGPGTGKTTVIHEILRYFTEEGKNVVLAAPTGRAAKRMTETCGFDASTIHRLLEIGPISEEAGERLRFGRNEENPLEADVIIVDEMSMVDIVLMHALLCATAPGTHLILVGDADQLPSVGPGNVLRDITEEGCFPTVRLTRIFRQEETGDIVLNAHRINRGEMPALDNRSRDFFFLAREDAGRIIGNMLTLIREKLPPYVGADAMDIQVLTPMRKGPLGVERLNAVLQQYLNPPSPDKAEHEAGGIVFRTGDKVMQIRNDYQIEWEVRGRYGIAVETGTGIFNGDIGIVREIDKTMRTMTVEFDEHRMVEYSFEMLGELELSYAVTIHKSQGSEYPAVLLPLLAGPAPLMNRNLLYTAVTRARKCVVILGREETLRTMVENVRRQERYTSLRERIREMQ